MSTYSICGDRIILGRDEIECSDYYGDTRNYEALLAGKGSTHGLNPDYAPAVHSLGARGELAFSLWGGYGDTLTVNTYHDGPPDVGPFEIRTAGRDNLSLIIRPGHENKNINPDPPFALVVSEPRYFDFRIVGWMTLTEAMSHPEWVRAPNGRPAAIFVPQRYLHPISEYSLLIQGE